MKKNITTRESDFANWFNDVCYEAKLFTYGNVKGTINYLPNSWKIWEKITKILDSEFKKYGIENVYCPLFIKMSDFTKEEEHINGFAPEAYIIDSFGEERMSDPLIVRPTSEVLFCQLFNQIVKNYKDLPIKYNQWCSVVRAEKNTKPFLRGTEIIWHEAHHLFSTKEEALKDVEEMRKIYDDFLKNYCCLAFISGKKTEGEKFAGAISTYTREIWSQDCQFIQTGTNHYLGTNFCKIYNISFQNKENVYEFPHYNSHGITQRIIGDIIVVHGDDDGLVIPYKLASTQIIIGTMFSNKNQNVLQEAKKIQDEFIKNDISCIIDDGNESFGFKINNSEVLGTPFFIAIGPKDIEKKQCILIRRDNNIKHTIQLDNLVDEINKQAIEYDKLMYEKSYNNLKNSIVYCENMDECIKAINENKIIIAPFGASAEEEEIFKQKTNAKPRCIVSEENFDLVNHLINEMIPKNKKCVITGKDAFAYVYFGRQY